MSRWKRALLGAAGFGAGVGIIALLTAVVYVRYQARPISWDSNAITATYSGIATGINTTVGDSDPKDWLLFHYTLTNNTDSDYRLDAPSAQLAAKLKGSGDLILDPELKSRLLIEYPLLIPARRSVRLTIFLSHTFAEQRPDVNSPEYSAYRQRLLAHLKNDLPSLGGFVLFDTARRYEISFADGWMIALEKEQTERSKASLK